MCVSLAVFSICFGGFFYQDGWGDGDSYEPLRLSALYPGF